MGHFQIAAFFLSSQRIFLGVFFSEILEDNFEKKILKNFRVDVRMQEYTFAN